MLSLLPGSKTTFQAGWRSRCAREPQPGDYLSIKREDWTLDTMRDLYETVITNYNNTRNEVAWIYEGMQEMGSKVTDMPGNKSDWITDEMHEMVFTVSVNPSCPATWTSTGNARTGSPGSLGEQTRLTPLCQLCPAPWTRGQMFHEKTTLKVSICIF